MAQRQRQITIRRLGRPGDLGWVVMTHGEIYAAEFGWEVSFEALVARIVADFAAQPDPRRDAAWIAEADGRRVGCVFCVTDPDHRATARLRVLLVHPDARGHRLGVDFIGQVYELELALKSRPPSWTSASA